MSESSKNNKDSIQNVIVIALVVCLFCAVVVAGSAVALKDRRVQNKALDKSKNVLIAEAFRQATLFLPSAPLRGRDPEPCCLQVEDSGVYSKVPSDNFRSHIAYLKSSRPIFDEVCEQRG